MWPALLLSFFFCPDRVAAPGGWGSPVPILHIHRRSALTCDNVTELEAEKRKGPDTKAVCV